MVDIPGPAHKCQPAWPSVMAELDSRDEVRGAGAGDGGGDVSEGYKDDCIPTTTNILSLSFPFMPPSVFFPYPLCPSPLC